MTLNKREQMIAVAVGICVAGLALYAGWDWWRARHNELLVKRDNAITKRNDALKTIDNGKSALAAFEKLGVQTVDPAKVDLSQTDRKVQTAFSGGGLTFTNWGSIGARPNAQNKDFMEARYTATTITTTAKLARFLNYIEHMKLPARIDGMTIITPKPGIDNLRVEFTVSALIYAPKPVKGAKTGTAAPASKPAATTSQPAASRPATSRPATSRPATATAPTQAELDKRAAELEKKAAEMAAARRAEDARVEAEMARLATMPKKTPEEIEAEKQAALEKAEQDMKARREAEAAAASKPADPTPTTNPATTTAPGGAR